LGQSSGFQSYQYRLIEFTLGNRNKAMMRPHAHREDITKLLTDELARPSVYDVAIRALHASFPVSDAVLNRDTSEPYVEDDSVKAAWITVDKTLITIGNFMNSPKNWSISRIISAAGALTM
jgi:tryptophan 2,3-dioxygenase